jgi:lysophospholipase L1-like esterase
MLKYIALGDSYTIGEAVAEREAFPCQLTGKLGQISAPTIIATTGWTTDELITAIGQRDIMGNKYDLVTVLIGVNDQYRGLSLQDYKIKFRQVLDIAIGLADGNPDRVFVLSIPDYGATPFGKENQAAIGEQIDQFNLIGKQISARAGVNYLDITGISRMAVSRPDLVASDGLHPSAKMYSMWVSLLGPMIAERLKLS